MNSRILNRLLSWLIVISPVWWTSGCYSLGRIEKPSDAGSHAIEVSTKGNNCYTFHQWTVDSLGTIKGLARWENPKYDVFGGRTAAPAEPRYLEGKRFVPKDSIAHVSEARLNVPLTVLVGLVGLAAATVVVLIVAFAIAQPGPGKI